MKKPFIVLMVIALCGAVLAGLYWTLLVPVGDMSSPVVQGRLRAATEVRLQLQRKALSACAAKKELEAATSQAMEHARGEDLTAIANEYSVLAQAYDRHMAEAQRASRMEHPGAALHAPTLVEMMRRVCKP
jgi:hypothetical protein